MDDAHAIGLSSPAASASQHIPVFAGTATHHDQAISSFVLEGLRQGHTCICICGHNLEGLIVAAGDGAAGDRLEVRSPADFPGHPSLAEEIVDFVTRSVGAGRRRQDSRQIWIVEELSSRLDMADSAGVLRYEAGLHECLRRCGARVMSVFDLSGEGREFLMGALKIHRHTIVGATAIENAFHLEPEDVAGRLGP